MTEPATLRYVCGIALVAIATYALIGTLWHFDIVSTRAAQAGALTATVATIVTVVTDEHVKAWWFGGASDR